MQHAWEPHSPSVVAMQANITYELSGVNHNVIVTAMTLQFLRLEPETGQHVQNQPVAHDTEGDQLRNCRISLDMCIVNRQHVMSCHVMSCHVRSGHVMTSCQHHRLHALRCAADLVQCHELLIRNFLQTMDNAQQYLQRKHVPGSSLLLAAAEGMARPPAMGPATELLVLSYV